MVLLPHEVILDRNWGIIWYPSLLPLTCIQLPRSPKTSYTLSVLYGANTRLPSPPACTRSALPTPIPDTLIYSLHCRDVIQWKSNLIALYLKIPYWHFIVFKKGVKTLNLIIKAWVVWPFPVSYWAPLPADSWTAHARLFLVIFFSSVSCCPVPSAPPHLHFPPQGISSWYSYWPQRAQ